MKFMSPIWLLLLLCVLALIGIYLLLQLRRKNYAARFTNVDMLSKIAPKRPGWRRHIAFALLVVGLGFTSMAMAVPASEVQVPRNRATICMALDVSLSMKATDVKPSRFESMKKSAKNFVDKLPNGINLGLVEFAGSANVLQPPTVDRGAVKNSIDNLKLDQATATGEAIFSCLASIQNFEKGTKSSDGKPAPARIVLLSDGLQTVGRDTSVAVAAAKKAKVPVSTIAFGTEGATIKQDGETIPVPVDKASLKKIADDTGGSFFSAESASSLEKVYNNIGTQIGYTKEFQPITTRFVGIGLIFAFASAAAALFWTNRLL